MRKSVRYTLYGLKKSINDSYKSVVISVQNTRIPSGNEEAAFDGFGNQEDKPFQEICQKQSLTKFHGENLQLEN